MSENLLPCPFCGPGNSQVSFWFDDVSKAWRAGCGRCGVSSGIHPYDRTQFKAAESWNTRAPSSASDHQSAISEQSAVIVPNSPSEASGGVGPCGWVAWHPFEGFDFARNGATAQEASAALMRSGIAGNHKWEVRPIYASPPPSASQASCTPPGSASMDKEKLVALLQSYSIDTVIRSFYARGIGESAGYALDNESAARLANGILAAFPREEQA